MRLEKIKLSGFKSFVDPTTITFPSALTGIVGPNGCGKSNIIDAVRWVMGELSAKQLRGESSTDVIFNGSRDRKPIGQAFVELVFDNSEGKLGGEYAQYSEIAIRREVARDGQSNYYLNGTKCRRRDITGIFLGTGLGPRSYAIIEQDMISRFIEAKPEELRSYLEEVAGISKYKERRKETESRIHRTRENLNRIHDICEELTTQLDRLKRQSRAAERYKVLKEEERLLKAQLLALRWRTFDHEMNQFNLVISERQTVLESHKANLQHIDTEIEKAQIVKTELNDKFQEIQTRYYEMGSQIARIEQAIEHQKSRQEQLEIDLQQTETSWQEAQDTLRHDQAQMTELNQRITELEPQIEEKREVLEQAQNALRQIEENMHAWQQTWDNFNEQAAHVIKTAELQQARIQHLEQQQSQAHQRLVKLDQEKQQFSSNAGLENELNTLIQQVEQAQQLMDEKRRSLTEVITKIDSERGKNQEISSQLAQSRKDLQMHRETRISLEALQQAALGQKDNAAVTWLENNNLHHHSRLAQELTVEKGWEKAVETVLGSYLEAVGVDGIDAVTHLLSSFEEGRVILFDTQNREMILDKSSKGTLLSGKVRSRWAIAGLLAGVYVVDSLEEALKLRKELSVQESVVTRGGIWLGQHWLRIAKGDDKTSGIIEREQTLREAMREITVQEKNIATYEQQLQTGTAIFNELKQKRAQLKNELSKAETQYAESNAKLQVIQSQADQIRQRHKRLDEEFNEQQQHIEQAKRDVEEAQRLWQEATILIEQNTEKREELLKQRDQHRVTLEEAQKKVKHHQEQLHEFTLEFELSDTKLSTLKQSVERIQKHLNALKTRQEQLKGDLSQDDVPLEQLNADLKEALEVRIKIEHELTAAKQEVEAVDQQMQEAFKKRHEVEQAVNDARTALEEKRMQGQEFKIRQTTLQEQLSESSFDLQKLLSELSEEATEAAWQEEIEKMAARIHRLGPINLAAIEEYQQCSERKTYLDAQHHDLEEALQTLQNAIRKIDRETRARFKEMFDKVNNTFQELFPKIFGGGNAYLELTGEDLLETGVSLMARPPGKRVSHIHLLSGGEKALTAIALVFSLFQLNPAPFCMLDEVDAPLDDANVGRFCDLVREMSKQIQFLFISHNKNAIQIANQLMGVTMHEPGVSRIVSVDVEAAVSMAES